MRLLQPLHVYISTLFCAMTLLVGGLIGGMSYHISADVVQTAANEQWARIDQAVQQELHSTLEPAEMALQFLRLHRITWSASLQERLNSLSALSQVLKGARSVSAVYVAYPNGDFFLLRQLDDRARQLLKTPSDAHMMVQSIERGEKSTGRFIFLDAQGEVIQTDDQPDYAAAFDPRSRPWWQQATSTNQLIQTRPYVFHTTGSVGITLAIPAGWGGAVVAADINLATLGTSLARYKFTPGTQLALVNDSGELLAHDRMETLLRSSTSGAMPRLADLQSAPLTHVFQTDQELALEQFRDPYGNIWRTASMWVPAQRAKDMRLLMAIPELELNAGARQQLTWSAIATLLIIALSMPLTWVLARTISQPLRRLVADVKAIQRFDFRQPIQITHLVKESHDLAITVQSMQGTIRRFLELSMAVAAEEHFDRLLPRLLRETMITADAGAGVLYLADHQQLIPACAMRPDGSILCPQALQTLATLALPTSTTHVVESDTALGGPLMARALQGRKVCSQLLTPQDRECLQLHASELGLGLAHGVAIPLLNRQREFVGAMVLLIPHPPEETQVSFVAALSGTAAVSLEARALIQEQKQLFEAFVELIAGAIDAKSPYTGGHCARVPELTQMLAQAACAQTQGPFADFTLSDQDWEAVHIASWLHDCGKVTTPEYVVDKATKLETIYDRIHEVRMRFEVLKRDAQIAMHAAIAAGTPPAQAQAQMEQTCRTLDEEFAFVAACNQGGEYLAPAQQERLRQIAQRTWLRTLDDTLGISLAEAERRVRTPLPVQEPLLADKPEHRIARQPRDRLAPDNPWGFQIEVPELLYNRGELYNLQVSRGTLSTEERYKINEHIVQTIKMLSCLPFPKHLRGVPEIAGGHHEKMDGTGYPRGLQRDAMSPVARMMAVADIFEALTAGDRPYKPRKRLSEALHIMAGMRREQHIDPEIFELFLRSGVYLEYAQRHMPPEFIDTIHIEDYLL